MNACTKNIPEIAHFNRAMVSRLDEELEGALNFEAMRADPLPPIVH